MDWGNAGCWLNGAKEYALQDRSVRVRCNSFDHVTLTLDSGTVLVSNQAISGTNPVVVTFTRTVASSNIPTCAAATPRLFVYNYSFSFSTTGTGTATALWGYGALNASCTQCATSASATPGATPAISDSATLTRVN